PELVELDGNAWPGVDSVAVERSAAREVVEYGDEGPYAAFVDVPRRKVVVRVTRSADEGLADELELGEERSVAFVAAIGGTDRGRVRATVAGVVTRVAYESKPGGVNQVVTLTGVSPDGGAGDPVAVVEL
ncbi:MAG: hypothetical protein AAF235_10005, partial [Planctomycetota bacterium]